MSAGNRTLGSRPREAGIGRRIGSRIQSIAGMLTTPLLPDDLLGALNPMWSRRAPRARVIRVERETPEATTLYLRPGAPFPRHRPGQFVGLGVQLEGVWHWRTYSLTSRPGDSLLSVTVTAVPGGKVSGVLAHGTGPGAIVALSPAAGEFTLPEPAPDRLLFVTAGSGITPVMGILRSLRAQAASGDPAARNALAGAVVVHSDRTPDDVIFGAELRELAAATGMQLIERHTAAQGRLTPGALAELVPDWASRSAWACGPAALLDTLTAHWAVAGDPAALHLERFQPPHALPTEGTGGRITFAASGIVADAEPETPVLAAGEQAGAVLPNGCRMGICYTCVAPLRSGAVRNLYTGELTDAAETPGRPIQTCVCAPAGDITIDL